MKKIINKGRYIAITILLSLFFQIESSAQLSVSKQWQQRMQDIIPTLKKTWIAGDILQTPVFDVGLTWEEFMVAKCSPIATFALDYASFIALTSESNLEKLIKLDTTRFDCDVFNEKRGQYVLGCGAIFRDGRWLSNGISTILPYAIDFRTQIHKNNIPNYRLQVKRTSDGLEKGYYFHIENGRLMTMTYRSGEGLRPLLEVLLEYLEEVKYREAVNSGVLNPPLPASYQRYYQQRQLEMQKR